MASARTIIGNYCFKKSIKYILDKVKLLDARQFIIFSVLKLIHKVISYGTPASIFHMFKKQNRRVNDKIIRTIYKPKKSKMSNHIIYKITKIYNSLPADLKNKTIKPFTKQLKILIQSTCVQDVGDGDKCGEDDLT